MIVDDRHLSRMIVEQVLCYLCIEQEVRIVELFHNKYMFKGFYKILLNAKITNKFRNIKNFTYFCIKINVNDDVFK